MLSSEKNSPRNAARVLALEEERLGLSVLEAENLGVTTDVKLALYTQIVSLPFQLIYAHCVQSFDRFVCRDRIRRGLETQLG